jgi:integrase
MSLGTWGRIRTYVAHRNARGKPDRYRALADYRDFDGRVRRVERSGRSMAVAENALRIALQERTNVGRITGGELTRAHRFSDAAALWLRKMEAAARSGRRSPGTVDTYRQHLNKHVLPALKDLRLGEMTVPLLDRFIERITNEVGPATAKACRSIVSGILRVAVRHGALAANPTREIEPIEYVARRQPRALTVAECAAWFRQLDADEDARDRDLPDLCRFLLATGVRIGEALAVIWGEVDREAGTVAITSTIIRVKGVGLVRKGTKSKAGDRTLLLPGWAAAMLDRRFLDDTHRLDEPVFPDFDGGWRDPSNTSRTLRETRGSEGFAWVTSHVFRKTAATILDEAGLSARAVADQLGHARPSMTQDVYMGRRMMNPRAAEALDGVFSSGTEGGENRG